MKYNNRILSFVFIGLLILVVLTHWLKSGSAQKNIKTTLVELDTSKVTALVIHPKVAKAQEVRLLKKDRQWYLQKEGLSIEIENDRIVPILGHLARLQILRMASRSKDKWKDFETDEATATQLQVLGANDSELLNLYIGKGGLEGSDVFTYVRKGKEEEVYAVKSPFSDELNKQANDWRDQTFIKFSPPDIRKVAFEFPGDSSFVLTQQNNSWKIDNTEADSTQNAKILDYLREIASLNLSNFEDRLKTNGRPEFSLNIEGVNMKPISIQAFRSNKKGSYLLSSSLNPKALFLTETEGDFARIFKGKSAF